MTNNHSLEEGLRKLLSDALSELGKLERNKQELEGNITSLRAEADAYETALQGYFRRTGRQPINEIIWTKMRKDKNHKERLIRLARHNGGRIKVNEASSLLYTKGIVKSKRRSNVYQIVQSLLSDMKDDGIFEKIAPGEYRLVGAHQHSLPGVS